MKIPKGIVEDVLVKVDKFHDPVDFVVLDIEPVAVGANYVPIILGRNFLPHQMPSSTFGMESCSLRLVT